MLSPEDYLLKQDRLIGHELLVEKIGVCGRRLRLKDVYYNQFISDLVKERESSSLVELSFELGIRKQLDLVRTFNPRRGETIGRTETSRRINGFGSLFRSKYLEIAKEILREKERELRHS